MINVYDIFKHLNVNQDLLTHTTLSSLMRIELFLREGMNCVDEIKRVKMYR